MSEYYVKKPCQHCPFRVDVKPFLHPDRGAELAFLAQKPYGSFSCHKTLGYDDDGDTIVTGESKECAGFLTLMAQELGEEVLFYKRFKPSYEIVYSDSYDMADAYEYQDRL